MAQDLQRSDVPLYRLEAIDFGRRMAVEKEIEKTETAQQPNAIFDESSNFLIYATLLGIKVRHAISFMLRLKLSENERKENGRRTEGKWEENFTVHRT